MANHGSVLLQMMDIDLMKVSGCSFECMLRYNNLHFSDQSNVNIRVILIKTVCVLQPHAHKKCYSDDTKIRNTCDLP